MFSRLAIFFALQAWEIEFPNWWGNPADGIIDHCPKGSYAYNNEFDPDSE